MSRGTPPLECLAPYVFLNSHILSSITSWVTPTRYFSEMFKEAESTMFVLILVGMITEKQTPGNRGLNSLYRASVMPETANLDAI